MHTIQFMNSVFIKNGIKSVISVVGEDTFDCAVVPTIKFVNCQFIGNELSQDSHLIDVIKGNMRILFVLKDCLFNNNINIHLIEFATAESFIVHV